MVIVIHFTWFVTRASKFGGVAHQRGPNRSSRLQERVYKGCGQGREECCVEN